MAEKAIYISFTQEQVKKYNGQGSRLCFSAGVGDNSAFNVIARAEEISSNVTITWRDDFKIAATKKIFTSGVKIENNTSLAKIEFNQTYTLPESWEDGRITPEKLPGSAFKLINQTANVCSAVIYKVIDGQDKPFYISVDPIDPRGGNEVMAPRSTVALWFEKNAETGTMVSKNRSDISAFDFANTSGMNLVWNGSHFEQK
ncbi:hypothetical protein F4777DRAFT_596385 [Nemania sp. FL0916]|nr:hypothetical protein F4777DRAFT_596385 [Nemania sp. FL0916]